MGYHSLIENVVLPQVVASSGLVSIALQLPPPDQPEPPSGQHFVALFLALAIFFALVWLLLSKKCCKKGSQ
jgi:hypothetical protein